MDENDELRDLRKEFHYPKMKVCKPRAASCFFFDDGTLFLTNPSHGIVHLGFALYRGENR